MSPILSFSLRRQSSSISGQPGSPQRIIPIPTGQSDGKNGSANRSTNGEIPSANVSRRTSETVPKARERRKLSLLKRSGLFGENSTKAVVCQASSGADLEEAYRLVHEVYTASGYIFPQGSGLRIRIFEAIPEMATFVAKVGGKIVGVLSVVGDSPELGLPSDAAFQDELAALRRPDLRICEMTNQAVAEEYRRTSIATELMRCAMAYAFQAGYGKAVAAVSAGHNGFYQLLGFQEIGSERSYSTEIDDPVIALSVDANFFRRSWEELSEVEQFVQHFMTGGNPYMTQVLPWSGEARRRFLKRSLLRHLFITEADFLSRCSARELQALERMWGRRMFAVVTGRSSFAALRNWLDALLSMLRVADDAPVLSTVVVPPP